MSIYKKPEVFVARGKEFSNLADAEFYEVGQRVQEDLAGVILEYADGPTVAQAAVNKVFDYCQVSLRNRS